jgi:hypothetical protein
MGSDSFRNCTARVRDHAQMPADPALVQLTAIPNVGPAVARRLLALGVSGPEDLRGADPERLYERACELAGGREDPCLLDTFTAVVAFAETGDERPWWAFSRARIARAGHQKP